MNRRLILPLPSRGGGRGEGCGPFRISMNRFPVAAFGRKPPTSFPKMAALPTRRYARVRSHHEPIGLRASER